MTSILFGGDRESPTEEFRPTRFEAGGLRLSTGGGGSRLKVTSTAARRARIGQLASRFGEARAGFGALREQVQPGFSRLRENIRQTFRGRAGGLRESFARRRLAGSSFAEEAQGRLAAEESRELNRSFLAELEASTQLLQLETQAAVNEVQTFLNEMNLKAGIAQEFAGQINAAMTRLNELEATLNAQDAAGRGEFFGGVAGTFLGPAASNIGARIGRVFA